MRYRRFGASGLRVSELFLGAMTFGEQGGVGAPAPAAHRLHRYLLGAHVGPPHAGRGDDARTRRRGECRADPVRRHLRHAGLGRRPGQYPGRVARLDRVRRSAGALQPAAAGHRARVAPDGREHRDDRCRLEPARRRDPFRQVHHAERCRTGHPRQRRRSHQPAARGRGHRTGGGRRPRRDPGAGCHRLDAGTITGHSPHRRGAPRRPARRQPRRYRGRSPGRGAGTARRGRRARPGVPANFIAETSPWVFGAVALA